MQVNKAGPANRGSTMIEHFHRLAEDPKNVIQPRVHRSDVEEKHPSGATTLKTG